MESTDHLSPREYSHFDYFDSFIEPKNREAVMFDNSVDITEALRFCRCCLLLPPVKDLKTPYEHHDKTEIYSDMIKDCFDVDIYLVNEECGICELCVGRLRDARDFKLQVQRSQAELWARNRALNLDEKTSLKSETDESSDGRIGLDIKIKPYDETSVKLDNDAAERDEDFTTRGKPPLKSDIADDATSDVVNIVYRNIGGTKKNPKKPNLMKHKRIQTSNKPVCDICGKSYTRKSTLVAHMRTHTGQRPFSCELCHFQFTYKSHLIRHKQIHTGDRPYFCYICEMRFKWKYNLTKHMRTHTGQRPFRCDHCKQQFGLKSDLIRHIRSHTGEKPYGCELCAKRFTRKGTLVAHIRIHTKQKPFSCEVCKLQFRHKSNLMQHKRIHMGDRPFFCYVCEKRFTWKSNLTKHMKVHTGHKPFTCEVCKHQFGLKTDLIRHKLVHTGEKPYECDICGKRFTRKISLATHIGIHTGKKTMTSKN